ncbi:MAG: cytochrome c [Pseudomonadota bacterium]
MKRIAMMGLVAAAFAFNAPVYANAEMIAKGEKLHAEKCAACHKAPHDAKFYESRVGKKIQSKASLTTMVSSCANHFNIDWFDDDVAAVSEYLNAKYYKLK